MAKKRNEPEYDIIRESEDNGYFDPEEKTSAQGVEIFSSKVLSRAGIEQNLPYVNARFRTYSVPETLTRRTVFVPYGKNNDYPYFLIELAKRSVVHNSAILSKTSMIYGGGLYFEGNSAEEASELFKELGINDILHFTICYDVALFGGAFPQIVMGKDEEAKGRVKKIYKPRFETVRVGQEKEKGIVESIQKHYYCRVWDKVRTSNDKRITPIDVWTKKKFAEKNKNLSYMIGNMTPLQEYYPTPDYLSEASINAIMLDAEIANFDLSEVINGMTASYIVTFFRPNYKKTDPEREKKLREAEEKQVKDNLLGASNTGRVIIQRALPSRMDLKAIDITPIPSTNSPEKHKIMTERKNVSIMSAHGYVAPELAGIPNLATSGITNQAERLITANELVYFNRIRILQAPILKFYNDLLEALQVDAVCKIRKALPISRTIDKTLWPWAFVRDEFREHAGYQPLTEEQKSELETYQQNNSNNTTDTQEPTKV